MLFVSHAFTLNLLLRRVLGLADSPSVFFRTDNCALHRLKRAPTGFWNVEALNDRRHLIDIRLGGEATRRGASSSRATLARRPRRRAGPRRR